MDSTKERFRPKASLPSYQIYLSRTEVRLFLGKNLPGVNVPTINDLIQFMEDHEIFFFLDGRVVTLIAGSANSISATRVKFATVMLEQVVIDCLLELSDEGVV